MSELAPGLDRRGARADRPLAGEPAAAVVAAVALPALFARAPQVLIQRTAGAFVGPDVAVDRFMADGERAVAPQPAGDLLRTPIFPQQPLDLRPVCGRESPIAARARAPAAGVPVGELGTVAAVARRAVAPQFAPDRAAVATQNARDRGRAQPSSPQQAERISFR